MYKTETISFTNMDQAGFQTFINYEAAKGWEFVTVIDVWRGRSENVMAVFRRADDAKNDS